VERRLKNGRFGNAIEDRALLAIVRAILEFVALHADPPVIPREVPQVAFDENRAAAGYPDVKRAWAICRQLKLTWSRLKEAALASDASATQTLAAAKRRGPSTLTRAHALRSIEVVATRLNARSLRPHTYEDERRQAVAEERQRWRHGTGTLVNLLTIGQIENIAPFEELVVEAGRSPRVPASASCAPAHDRHRSARSTPAAAAVSRPARTPVPRGGRSSRRRARSARDTNQPDSLRCPRRSARRPARSDRPRPPSP
jgi:hypothetical protein